MLTAFKNSFTSKLNDIFVMKYHISSQLKCLAILPCDLSLITIHISDCRQFSGIHISQGSVATYLRCGGMFDYEFVANLPLNLSVKELWKSVNIWGSYGQEFSIFLDSRCITVVDNLDLDMVKLNHHAWCLDQRLFCLQVYKQSHTNSWPTSLHWH